MRTEQTSAEALELRGIRKRYARKTVLRDISRQGTIVGMVGSNGCGKSTLLGILAGVIPADGGSFLWRGEDLLRAPEKRREAVGYVPQGTPLMEELSALDNLRLWYDRDTLEQDLEHGMLKTLGIPEFLRVRVSRMSGGMKKRLVIGCAIARTSVNIASLRSGDTLIHAVSFPSKGLSSR